MLSQTAPAPIGLLQPVLSQLEQIQPLCEPARQGIAKASFLHEIKKGTFLLKQGDISQNIYFIVSGMLSGQSKYGDKHICTFLSVDGQFVSAIEGLYGIVPASEDILAEEDSILLSINSRELQKLFDQYIALNILMRKILERYYQEAHQRSVFIRMASATEKYAYLRQTYPAHADRIPLEVAASFLNLKPATLSGIIKKTKPNPSESSKSRSPEISKEDIASYMNCIKPHLQQKLTLHELATQFHTSSHQLSQLLNNYFHENFNHFVNRHRIGYVIEQLGNEKNRMQYNLEGLGKMAGFSSKTTFFLEFKKHTGHTPASYLNSFRPSFRT